MLLIGGGGIKHRDGLMPLLFNTVLNMAIKETNMTLEVFSIHGPGMIVIYAVVIDTLGSGTTKTKKMLIKTEKESKKVGLNISENKIYACQLQSRQRQNRAKYNYGHT